MGNSRGRARNAAWVRQRAQLVRELDVVAQRPPYKFLAVDRADEDCHAAPLLVSIVAENHPDEWPVDPQFALFLELRDAVGRLPDEIPEHTQLSWRKMGSIVFRVPLREETSGDNSWQRFSSSEKYSTAKARIPVDSGDEGKRRQKLVGELREMVATELLSDSEPPTGRATGAPSSRDREAVVVADPVADPVVMSDAAPIPAPKTFRRPSRVIAAATICAALVITTLVIKEIRDADVTEGDTATAEDSETSGEQTFGDENFPAYEGTSDCPAIGGGDAQDVGDGEVVIEIYVREAQAGECFARDIALGTPQTRIQFLIRYANNSDEVQQDVNLRASLPPRTYLIPGTTFLFNEASPDGRLLQTNLIADGGFTIGSYAPAGAAHLYFDAVSPSRLELECGNTESRAVGAARPDGMNEYYNTSIVRTGNSC